GLLEQRKRLGTIVKRNKIQQEFTHIIQSYNQEMGAQGLESKTKVLYFQKIIPSSDIQVELNLPSSEKVFKLVRLRYAGKLPLVKVTTYLPASLVPDLEKVNFSTASLYRELEKRDLAVTHVVRKLEVKTASSEIAKDLDIKKNAPIFYFHTHGYTNKDQLIEYSIATYRGDMNSFVIDLKG
ncbi:GntR family transcriptional regulator, partial [Lactobacillus sp.]